MAKGHVKKRIVLIIILLLVLLLLVLLSIIITGSKEETGISCPMSISLDDCSCNFDSDCVGFIEGSNLERVMLTRRFCANKGSTEKIIKELNSKRVVLDCGCNGSGQCMIKESKETSGFYQLKRLIFNLCTIIKCKLSLGMLCYIPRGGWEVNR